jgi:penicillin-binding protein 1B
MELSLNVPTVRVALRTGIDNIRETARAMGVTSPLPAVPALALGACELTPLEVGILYATLAGGGRRPEAWSLEAVVGPDGEGLVGAEVALPERALRPEVAYLVTSMLRGVVDRGTAWRARQLGVQGPLAGKTGTTDDQRDSWFAGYSADRVTVVWVGYDANRPTRLTGSRGALPLWSRFTARVAPAGGYAPVERPSGFVEVELDPESGLLATPLCPRTVREELPRSMAPLRRCDGHGSPSPLALFDPRHGSAAPPSYGDRTLGDLLGAAGRERPPVRLEGDVTRLFGAGRDIRVEGPSSPLEVHAPTTEPTTPGREAGATHGDSAPATPSIVVEPARAGAAADRLP